MLIYRRARPRWARASNNANTDIQVRSSPNTSFGAIYNSAKSNEPLPPDFYLTIINDGVSVS